MIRARYRATTCFSFRREQATTKMAQTYFCPTPYAVKIALIISGIRKGMDPYELTKELRKAEIIPQPWGEGVVNTHLVKHWEPPRGNKLPPDYLSPTVVYREFLYFDGGVDLYLEPEIIDTVHPLLTGVYSFGKQGSFFVFENIKKNAELPAATTSFSGSDFKDNATWEKVSNFEGSNRKPRENFEMEIAMTMRGASGDNIHYKFEE
jgi:hypothetical protein